jgi:hypothetical protein
MAFMICQTMLLSVVKVKTETEYWKFYIQRLNTEINPCQEGPLARRFEASDVADREVGFRLLRVKRSNRIKFHPSHFDYTFKCYPLP